MTGLILSFQNMFALVANAQDHATLNVARQVNTLRSAMNSFATDTRQRVDAMQKELDAFKACAEKSMVYAPKSAQADVHGCLTIGGGSYRHGVDGYQWIGSTLFQWGQVCGVPASWVSTFNFPTPFPNAAFSIVGNMSTAHNGGASRARLTMTVVSNTQYSIGMPDSTVTCVNWQAIGN